MAGMIALACGVFTAQGVHAGDNLALGPAADTTLAAGSAIAMGPADIGGRWTGTPHAIKHDASRCGPDGCKLTLDIVKCGAEWCGIEVSKDNACGAAALHLKSHADTKREAAFEGKLSLGKDTQDYFVDVTYRGALDSDPPRLYFIGDTGPEMMMFRRSFPFHTTLARTGDAVCKTEKPIS